MSDLPVFSVYSEYSVDFDGVLNSYVYSVDSVDVDGVQNRCLVDEFANWQVDNLTTLYIFMNCRVVRFGTCATRIL